MAKHMLMKINFKSYYNGYNNGCSTKSNVGLAIRRGRKNIQVMEFNN